MIQQELKKRLSSLVKDGRKLYFAILWEYFPEAAAKNGVDKIDEKVSIHADYHAWFTACSSVLKGFAPDRYSDFIEHYYAAKNRKNIQYSNYKIQDWLVGTTPFNISWSINDAFFTRFQDQLLILQSTVKSFDYIAQSISDTLQAAIFDNELDAAEELLKKKYLRASGIIAGVVLEGHLKSICAKHNVKFQKKKPTLSDFYEGLKQHDIIDVPTWRHIQRLADIRNLCGHKAEREPVIDEIEDIIRGTKKIITSVF